MWEARLWLALDHETPVDIVSTMGPDIEVEQLLELYFVAHPLVDWRETIRETGCAVLDLRRVKESERTKAPGLTFGRGTSMWWRWPPVTGNCASCNCACGENIATAALRSPRFDSAGWGKKR